MFEAVILILQVFLTSIRDILYHSYINIIFSFWNVACKRSEPYGKSVLNVNCIVYCIVLEDIPYLELTYLLQLMVLTLNETAIYHIKILTQHEMAPDYIWLNIPLQIDVPCMEMTKTRCSEVNFNLESLSNCSFFDDFFFWFCIYRIF